MKSRWLTHLVLGAGSLLVAVNTAHAEPTPVSAGATTAAPAPVAAAPSAPKEEAVALFRQGQLLLEAGQTEQACAAFERSLDLQSGVGTKFNLADCWQKLGRTASAHALFGEVVQATRNAGQTERAALAQGRVDALTPILSRVDLQIDAQERDLSIKIDGELVPAATLNAPIALDPGTHELRGERAGHQPWTLPVKVPQGPVLMVIVAPKSVPLEPAPKPVAAVEPAPVISSPPSDPARDSGPSGAAQALRYSLLGVGVIGVAVGATMATQFYDSNENAKDVCPTSRNCSRDEIERHAKYVEDAKSARTWAWVGGGVGTAALVTAALLWLSDSDSDEDQATLQPWFGDMPLGRGQVADAQFGASLRGTF